MQATLQALYFRFPTEQYQEQGGLGMDPARFGRLGDAVMFANARR